MCAPNVPLDMGGILVELLSQTSKLIERVDCLTVKVESVESNMNSQISGLAVEMRGLAVAQSLQLEELSILSSQSQSSSSSKQSERVLDVVADHRWICPVCHRMPPFSHADSFKGHIRNLFNQPLNNSAHCYLHAASAEHRSLVDNFPGECFDVKAVSFVSALYDFVRKNCTKLVTDAEAHSAVSSFILRCSVRRDVAVRSSSVSSSSHSSLSSQDDVDDGLPPFHPPSVSDSDANLMVDGE
jgi:hypothetical protein